MSANTNFICYAGFPWVRSFEFESCDDTFSLDGYGVDIYITDPDGAELLHLSVGSGITVSGNTASAELSDIQTAAIDVAGLPEMTITEMRNQECCGSVFQGPIFDTKTGPTANFSLFLTPLSGSPEPPYILGKFLIYPEQI